MSAEPVKTEDHSIIVTADLITIEGIAGIPERFRFLSVTDSLAQPVESEALPEVLAQIIEEPLRKKAQVYAHARKVWRLTDEDIDALRLGLIAVYLRTGSTRDPEDIKKPKITPPASRVRTAAIASLNALRDELRTEHQHRFGNPSERTRNGVTTPAKRPMRRSYTDELNPDNRQDRD